MDDHNTAGDEIWSVENLCQAALILDTLNTEMCKEA